MTSQRFVDLVTLVLVSVSVLIVSLLATLFFMKDEEPTPFLPVVETAPTTSLEINETTTLTELTTTTDQPNTTTSTTEVWTPSPEATSTTYEIQRRTPHTKLWPTTTEPPEIPDISFPVPTYQFLNGNP